MRMNPVFKVMQFVTDRAKSIDWVLSIDSPLPKQRDLTKVRAAKKLHERFYMNAHESK